LEQLTQLDHTDLEITCVYIDFDGENFGPQYNVFSIKPYRGVKPIISFLVFPLRFSHGRVARDKREANPIGDLGETFRKIFITRGGTFVRMSSSQNMLYAGRTLYHEDEVESQVVVDVNGAFSHDISWKPHFSKVSETVKDDPRHGFLRSDCHEGCCRDYLIDRTDWVLDDDAVDNIRYYNYKDDILRNVAERPTSVAFMTRHLVDIYTAEGKFDEEDYLIMSYRVFGYVFFTRKWDKLDLDHLSEIWTS
jgi:hypothetical protein